MEKYCAIIGVDAPNVPWSQLEGSEVFRYFTGRIIIELDKAYLDGYRMFPVCLGSTMDLYLAMELVGLKMEAPDVGLLPYEVDCLDLSRLSDFQLWMRKKAIAECKTGYMFGSLRTDLQQKTQIVADAQRVILASASFYDPNLLARERALTEIPGSRELIEIPLIQQFQVYIKHRGISGK